MSLCYVLGRRTVSIILMYVFAFGLLMSSYIAFLDAAADAGKPEARGTKRLSMPVHRNEAPTLDSQSDHAERIVARLTSEAGAEETSKLLEALAKKEIESLRRRSKVDADGSQPSAVDLTAGDDDDEDFSVPHCFGCAL